MWIKQRGKQKVDGLGALRAGGQSALHSRQGGGGAIRAAVKRRSYSIVQKGGSLNKKIT